MENQKILVTGERGYLISSLVNVLRDQNIIVPYDNDVREYKTFSDIDIILHFASPSDDFDFKDEAKTTSTIINGTVNLLNIARKNKAKFIFASTMGIYFPVIDNPYAACKLAMEKYICSMYDNYIILRIPRVYSRCRQKGLMKKLRLGLVPETDMKKQVQFITLDEFVSQTMPILDQVNIIHEYNVTHKENINKIKEFIV